MDSSPTLAIVTICKNDLDRLVLTIDSVISDANWCGEYLIKNAGSSEATAAYISDIECDFITYIEKPDDGIYDAFNQAAGVLTSDYVMFLNCGDVLLGEIAIEKIKKNLDGTGMILFSYQQSAGLGKKMETPPVFNALFNGLSRLPTCHQAILYRTDLLREVPFDVGYKIAGDFEHMLRAISLSYSLKVVEGNAIVDIQRGGIADSQRVSCMREYARAITSVTDHGPMYRVAMFWYGLWLQMKYVVKVILQGMMSAFR